MAKKNEELPEENEVISSEEAPLTEENELPQEEGISFESELAESGAQYWNFDENPDFIGSFINAFIPDRGKKAGETIGFNFQRYLIKDNRLVKSEEIWIISNADAVEQVLNRDTPRSSGKPVKDCDCILKMKYLGKDELEGGRSYNRFKIDVLWPSK